VESVLVVFWADRAVAEMQAVSNSINLFPTTIKARYSYKTLLEK